jgi:hypothetical protein
VYHTFPKSPTINCKAEIVDDELTTSPVIRDYQDELEGHLTSILGKWLDKNGCRAPLM